MLQVLYKDTWTDIINVMGKDICKFLLLLIVWTPVTSNNKVY
jgi:hypothetical protein